MRKQINEKGRGKPQHQPKEVIGEVALTQDEEHLRSQ